MLVTYTFYLFDREGGRQFEPVICASEIEAIGRARALKNDRPDCAAVEVFFGEDFVVRID